MSIVLQSSGGGSVTLQEPSTASNFTVTVPAVTGTAVVTGTTPTLNGITFPATQVPSADANTLDDYEEGTWTPVVTSNGGAITSYTTSTCSYTKIGRFVTASFNVTITNAGTGSGFINITMPFFSGTGNISIGAGREDATTGKELALLVNTGTNICNTFFYDNTYPGATNNRLLGTVTFYTT